MSHNLSDEFDVEYGIFFSGSITGQVMSGSIFDPDTNTGATTGRKRIADHSSGSNYLKMVETTGEVIPHSVFYLFRRKHSIGTNYRYSIHSCKHEVFDDSLVPNMYKLYRKNGGAFVYAKTEAATPWDDNPPLKPFKIVLGYPDITASFTLGNPSTQISNNSWLYAYPFEQQYSSIEKTYTYPTPYDVTDETDGSDFLDTGPPPHVAYNAAGASGYILDPEKPFLELLSPKNINVAITAATDIKYCVTTEIYGAVFYANNQYNITSVGYSSSKDQVYKHFFGIGDGYRNQVLFESLTEASGGSANFYLHGQGAIVRGWKYGLYNAFPRENVVVFSRKRFGHVRDMFEQRKYTKFFDPVGINTDGSFSGRVGAQSSPINITFVSGSNAYISASAPTLFNLNDSGIYHNEYRSRKPFRDTT